MNNIINFNRAARRKAQREADKIAKTLSKTNVLVDSMADVDFSGMKFPIIVLFDKPTDYPDTLIARVFELNYPTNIVAKYKSVDDAREDAHFAGFGNLVPRHKDDDPHIVESYIQ